MAGRRCDVLDVREMLRRLRLGESARAVAKGLGVSRNTVREALRSLEAIGALTRRPNRGSVLQPVDFALVAEISQALMMRSTADLHELLVARRLLEVGLLPIAAERAVAADYAAMESANRRIESEAAAGWLVNGGLREAEFGNAATARKEISKALRAAISKAGYCNAGTVEFLMDEKGNLYFIEVNARVQVEHPVTEFVTGVDIVKEQIRIAAGQRLSVRQHEIEVRGHSIECRVNAEDPVTFTPSPGLIHAFSVPGGPGVRVDTFAHSECTVTPYYDSLIAKIITYGRDRTEALARMRRTLEMTVVDGIKTSIPLHLKVLNDPDFIAGRFSTSFMERYMPDNAKKTATGSLAESA